MSLYTQTTISIRHSAIVSMGTLIVSLMISPPSFSHNNAQGECREIKDDSSRLACFDESHHTNKPDSEPTVIRSVLTEAPSEETLISIFGLSENELNVHVPEKFQLKSIYSVITKSTQAADKTYIIQLENGQVWKQIQPGRLKVKANQKVKISKNLLSYRLNPDVGRSFTVRRIE